MSAASKHRQPRLRASCDGCFLAKVKCSKARPICSRCLACGIECRYSPSSRAGKPKADPSASHSHSRLHSNGGNGAYGRHHHNCSVVPDMAAATAGCSPVPDYGNLLYPEAKTAAMAGPGLYKLGTGWPSAGMDGAEGTFSRNHSISSDLALLAMDDNAVVMAAAADFYGPWTPPDLAVARFVDAPLDGTMHTHAGSAMPWIDTSAVDVFAYGQAPTPSSTIVSPAHTYFSSPSATPSQRQSPDAGHFGRPGTSCTCFTACIHALQALHDASPPARPPFDAVLTLNRSAIDVCSSMLACSRCMGQSGTHTSVMLLATVMGKITSVYREAARACITGHSGSPPATSAALRPGPMPTEGLSAAAAGGPPARLSFPYASSVLTGLGVSFGAYPLQAEDGRWRELESLVQGLGKLQEVHARFREVCGDLSEDADMSKAIIGYLGQTLDATLDLVNFRKQSVHFA